VNVDSNAARRHAWCAATVILLLSVLITPTSLPAQVPASRFFASAGGGIGKSGPAQSNGLDQFTGPSFELAAGATMTSRGLIGLNGSAWHRDTPIGSSRSLFVTLSLIGYPFGSLLNNLYFQGGVGVGHGSFPTHTTASTVTRLNATHPALLLGAGYDIPIACPLWIAPFFQSYGTFGGHSINTRVSGNAHESANAVLFHVGLSLKYVHPGPAGQCRKRGPSITE
jgi:hypothetical protein